MLAVSWPNQAECWLSVGYIGLKLRFPLLQAGNDCLINLPDGHLCNDIVRLEGINNHREPKKSFCLGHAQDTNFCICQKLTRIREYSGKIYVIVLFCNLIPQKRRTLFSGSTVHNKVDNLINCGVVNSGVQELFSMHGRGALLPHE